MVSDYGVELLTSGQQDASEALAKQKSQLPVVESSCKPSGVLPLVAVFGMAVAALIGAALAIPAGMLLAGAARFVTIGLYEDWSKKGDPVGFFTLAGSLVMGVVFLLAATVVCGMICARAVAAGGRLGKNRNAIAAGVSAGTAAALVVFALYHIEHRSAVVSAFAVLDHFDPFGLKGLGSEELLLWGIGGLLTLCVAYGMAAYRVDVQKFCEACTEFLSARELPGVGWDGGLGLKSSAVALEGGALGKVIREHPGQDVQVQFFECPKCGGGCLECTAWFRARWGDSPALQDSGLTGLPAEPARATAGTPGTLSEQWLFVSRTLTAEQARALQGELEAVAR